MGRIIDFGNSSGKHTNIQGYLAVLDSRGGSQKKTVTFNEIGVSHRKTQTFKLKEERVLFSRLAIAVE